MALTVAARTSKRLSRQSAWRRHCRRTRAYLGRDFAPIERAMRRASRDLRDVPTKGTAATVGEVASSFALPVFAEYALASSAAQFDRTEGVAAVAACAR